MGYSVPRTNSNSLKLSGKQVLVTGATGFIGGRLVEKLVMEHHADVRTLVRDFGRASRIARFDIEMVRGDITDSSSVAEAIKGCEVIFNCAYDLKGSREKRKQANVVGTENVAKAALRAGTRLVHVSTVDVYGWPFQETLDESCPRSPGPDIYAQTKFAGEELLWSYHRQHTLPLVIVQPTIIYGPFSRPWTLSVVERLKNRQVVLIDGGEGICNAVYIDDVVDALILAGTEPRALGEAFLISGPEPSKWREFYGAFEWLLGKKGTVSISSEEAERWRTFTASSLQDRMVNAAKESRILRRAYEKSRVFVPRAIKELIKSTVLNPRNGSSKSGKERQTIEPVDESRLKLYRTHCRVKIDKARHLLGYEPAFNFERGMRVTGQFLKWVGLVPNEDILAAQWKRAVSRVNGDNRRGESVSL